MVLKEKFIFWRIDLLDNNIKNTIYGVIVFIAGLLWCTSLDGYLNRDSYSQFTGICVLFATGICTYLVSRILDELKKISNKEK